jgi:hypothetical protein
MLAGTYCLPCSPDRPHHRSERVGCPTAPSKEAADICRSPASHLAATDPSWPYLALAVPSRHVLRSSSIPDHRPPRTRALAITLDREPLALLSPQTIFRGEQCAAARLGRRRERAAARYCGQCLARWQVASPSRRGLPSTAGVVHENRASASSGRPLGGGLRPPVRVLGQRPRCPVSGVRCPV